MTEVVGIRFKKAGKTYYFAPGDYRFSPGDYAIVETARGVEYGLVVRGNFMVPEEKLVQPLKEVLRPGTEEDAAIEAENLEKEKEALQVCAEKIAALELPMKLVDAEITFDHNKMIFYFTSDGRVDFRELVKELAAAFHTRIELRQIGVRDEAKMLNGIGICGRPLCCATFLGDFQPVSIKMAKEQKLSLNPTKISGICGRLMCCLKYEEDVYEELNKKLPGIGDLIRTDDGIGEVLAVNVLMQMVKAGVKKSENDAPTIAFYNVDEVAVLRKKKQRKTDPLTEEELAMYAREIEEKARKKREEAGLPPEPPKKREPHRGTEPREGSRRKPENRGEGREERKPEERNEGRSRRRTEPREARENRERGNEGRPRNERNERNDRSERGEKAPAGGQIRTRRNPYPNSAGFGSGNAETGERPRKERENRPRRNPERAEKGERTEKGERPERQGEARPRRERRNHDRSEPRNGNPAEARNEARNGEGGQPRPRRERRNAEPPRTAEPQGPAAVGGPKPTGEE